MTFTVGQARPHCDAASREEKNPRPHWFAASPWVLRLGVRLFDPYRVGIVLCRVPRVAAFGLTLGYILCPLRGRKEMRVRIQMRQGADLCL